MSFNLNTVTLDLRDDAGTITVRLDAIQAIDNSDTKEVRLKILPHGVVWCVTPHPEVMGMIYRNLSDRHFEESKVSHA